jgi:hypothetical protein
MDEAISYRTATVEDALSMCALGQLLNAVHHAVRPDIYAAAHLPATFLKGPLAVDSTGLIDDLYPRQPYSLSLL